MIVSSGKKCTSKNLEGDAEVMDFVIPKLYLEVKKLEFRQVLYYGDLLAIGKYLSTLARDPAWSTQEFNKIRNKSYKFFLKDGYLWRQGKQRGIDPLRVFIGKESRKRIWRNVMI